MISTTGRRPVIGAAVRGAGQGELRDRRVDHTVGTVLLEQTGRDRENTAGDCDVLADEHDALVALQLLVERLPEGVTELELGACGEQ